MAWRTLLACEHLLAEHSKSVRAGAIERAVETAVQQRKVRLVALLSAAWRSEGLVRAATVAPKRVAIVCGVAHVEALAQRIEELGSSTVLAANADSFPHLLHARGQPSGNVRSSTTTERPLSDLRVWERLRDLSSYSGPAVWPLAFLVYGVLPVLFLLLPVRWDFQLVQENLRRRN